MLLFLPPKPGEEEEVVESLDVSGDMTELLLRETGGLRKKACG